MTQDTTFITRIESTLSSSDQQDRFRIAIQGEGSIPRAELESAMQDAIQRLVEREQASAYRVISKSYQKSRHQSRTRTTAEASESYELIYEVCPTTRRK